LKCSLLKALFIAAALPLSLLGAECTLTVSAFNSQGFPTPIAFVDIFNKNNLGLSLRREVTHVRSSTDHTSYVLHFPLKAQGGIFVLKSRTSGGGTQTDTGILNTCKDYISVVVGQSNANIDTAGSLVEGQLDKCSNTSTLWIRAFPMFGGAFRQNWAEGLVEQSTCKFHLVVDNWGVRYVFIVGKGNVSLGTFDRNIVGSAVNRLGKVEIVFKSSP
jgi:hypothetical protein